MPCVHEFQIIEDINSFNEGDYEFYKEDSAYIEDDLINEIYHLGAKYKLDDLNVYWCNLNRPNKGLAWYGVSIIPPNTLVDFKRVIEEACFKYRSDELIDLLAFIRDAIDADKWVLHLGI